ncbi:hypothetical protein UlMin_018114 [Ulmus minor]
MPNNFQKSIQEYIIKIKKQKLRIHFPSKTYSNSFSSSRIFSGCKHDPKTLSFAVGRNAQEEPHEEEDEDEDEESESATLSDIDRFLFENFKSLYVNDKEENGKRGESSDRKIRPVLFESPRFSNPPPSLCSSNRFFVSTGISSSIVDEARGSVATSSNSDEAARTSSISTEALNNDKAREAAKLPDQCVAVLKCSPNPYGDFRSSMHEMVEARLRNRSSVDWNFMEELLFCYLNLNEKKSHKYVLSAYVDLIVELRSRSPNRAPVRSRNVRERRRRRKVREVT